MRIQFTVSIFFLLLYGVNAAQAITPTAEIGNQKIYIEVAQTPQEIQRGLMYRRSLAKDHGMVFLFRPPQKEKFWMAHCFISLDMLFILNGKIIKIFENVPPCREEDTRKCPTYPSKTEPSLVVSEVVEVNAGYTKAHGIKVGDGVKFTLP